MERTAQMFQSIGAKVVRKDPVRVLRWSVALFYPLSTALVPLIRRLWCIFTVRMNKGEPKKKKVDGGIIMPDIPPPVVDTHHPRAAFVRAIAKAVDKNRTTSRKSNTLLGSPSTGNLLWI